MSTSYRIALLGAAVAALTATGCSSGDSTSAVPGTPAEAGQQAEADVSRMATAAVLSNKVGAPVEVRYLQSGVSLKEQPSPLDLAVIPLVDGTNLRVTLLESDSVSVDADGADTLVAKVDARTVHRQRLTVTPKVSDGGTLRVMVSMDTGGGRYISIFAVPVGQAAPSVLGEEPSDKGAPFEGRKDGR